MKNKHRFSLTVLLIWFMLFTLPAAVAMASSVSRDTEGKEPFLEVIYPMFSEVTVSAETKEILVWGKTEPGATVTVNGSDAWTDAGGNFSCKIPLADGYKTDIKVVARNKSGGEKALRFKVLKPNDIYLTPEGHFRIYFSYTGDSDRSREYAVKLGKYLEQSWRKEVDTFGFRPPALDSTGRLNIYVGDFLAKLIGGKAGVGASSPIPVLKFIEIAPGLDDITLAQTAAHELFHQIQDSYISLQQNYTDKWWLDATATYIQNEVFPDNLFYQNQLLDYYLDGPRVLGLGSDGGYSSCIFVKFLVDRYGLDIIKQILDRMDWFSKSTPELIDEELRNRGSNMADCMRDFALWSFDKINSYLGCFVDYDMNYCFDLPGNTPVKFIDRLGMNRLSMRHLRFSCRTGEGQNARLKIKVERSCCNIRGWFVAGESAPEELSFNAGNTAEKTVTVTCTKSSPFFSGYLIFSNGDIARGDNDQFVDYTISFESAAENPRAISLEETTKSGGTKPEEAGQQGGLNTDEIKMPDRSAATVGNVGDLVNMGILIPKEALARGGSVVGILGSSVAGAVNTITQSGGDLVKPVVQTAGETAGALIRVTGITAGNNPVQKTAEITSGISQTAANVFEGSARSVLGPASDVNRGVAVTAAAIIQNSLNTAFGVARDTVNTAAGVVQWTASAATDAEQGAVKAASGVAQGVMSTSAGVARGTADTVAGAAQSVWTGVSGAAGGGMAAAGSAVQNTVKAAANIANSIINSVRSQFQASPAPQQPVTNFAQNTVNAVAGTVQGTAGIISSATRSMVNTAANIAAGTAQSAVNTVIGAARDVNTAAGAAAGAVKSTVNTATGTVRSALENTAGIFSSLVGSVGGMFGPQNQPQQQPAPRTQTEPQAKPWWNFW